jgi:hypothetical protein
MAFVSLASRRLPSSMLAVAALFTIPAPLAAQGDLLIAPTRLVLDGRRGGEVTLSNIGTEEATYRISLELRRMSPDGELEPVEEADANVTEKAALEMIRYAPRRVILPPGEPQAIRITARPGAELPDGEYRVHMAFAAVPKVRPIEPAQDGAANEGVQIRLLPIFGITMPIIVRKGEIEVTAALANPRIEQTADGANFAVDIARSGTGSVYGDLLVYHQGSNDPVFVLRGIGVYPEIEARHSSFDIPGDQATAMRGPVHIELREALEAGGKLIASMDAVL